MKRLDKVACNSCHFTQLERGQKQCIHCSRYLVRMPAQDQPFWKEVNNELGASQSAVPFRNVGSRSVLRASSSQNPQRSSGGDYTN